MASDASEIDALHAALAAAEARATEAEAQMAEAARERAVLTSAEATIAALRLEIEKLRRALYGTRSERKARLQDLARRVGWLYLCHHTGEPPLTALLWLYRALEGGR